MYLIVAMVDVTSTLLKLLLELLNLNVEPNISIFQVQPFNQELMASFQKMLQV